ncbi:hypothetical protein BWP39_26515 [Paraburkholderia acidicola]|uniref:Uncharacterized protein n=1 Tax=Paraburkholderia acidicola TaxID=1912599 RepID=A0A2A4ES26_9BURK|nr:hypothetical protein [Paraburkholderia acidicola]PCE23242.1 hypothetical protein BWP39_26515 [Paraburkholderia acidicola]
MNRNIKGSSDRRTSRHAVWAPDHDMIDLAPRWRTLVPILLSAIEHGTEHGRSNARRSLRNLAEEADSSRQLQLRTREALARLVATWSEKSEALSVEEKDALAEASAVLALTGKSLMDVRHE